MLILTRIEKGCAVLEVTGRLDAGNAPDFEQRCHAERGTQTRVALDFSRLEYISSAGLRSLLNLARALKQAGGGLALCGINGFVRDVIEVSGFNQFLPIYATSAEAVEAKL